MSVGWPRNTFEANFIAVQEICSGGTLSGEDSDMNVQAT